jgi:hypothetical protein
MALETGAVDAGKVQADIGRRSTIQRASVLQHIVVPVETNPVIQQAH